MNRSLDVRSLGLKVTSLSKYILEVHLHTYKTFLCYSYRLCRSRTRLWDQSAASVKVKGKNRQLGEQNSSPPHLKYFVWVKLTLHSCVVFWPSGVYFCRSVLLVYVLFTKSGKVWFRMVLKPQERKCLLCLSDKKGQSLFWKYMGPAYLFIAYYWWA